MKLLLNIVCLMVCLMFTSCNKTFYGNSSSIRESLSFKERQIYDLEQKIIQYQSRIKQARRQANQVQSRSYSDSRHQLKQVEIFESKIKELENKLQHLRKAIRTAS